MSGTFNKCYQQAFAPSVAFAIFLFLRHAHPRGRVQAMGGGDVLVGWGSAGDGQLGEASSEVIPRPRTLPGLPDGLKPTSYTAGLWSSVVVGDRGSAVFQTAAERRAAPQEVFSSSKLPTIVAVACGRDFTLLASQSGQLYSRGSGAYGQLGLGADVLFSPEPAVITSLEGIKIVALAAAEFHWLALDSLGQVFSCGRNGSGQLGLAHTDNVSTPAPVTSLWPYPVVSVATGDNHSAVLTALGVVLCFGDNKLGQLGQHAYHVKVCSLTPVMVSVPQNGGFQKVSSTSSMQDVQMTDASTHYPASMYSINSSFQNTTDKEDKEKSAKSLTYVDVACGQSHTVALRSDGVVVCWGKGENGQLGTRATRTMYTPTTVQVSEEFVAVSAGALHTAAVTSTGVLYMWGDGSLGQIGDGDISDKLLPVPLPAPKPFQHAPGSEHELSEVEVPYHFLSMACGGFHNIGFVTNDATAKAKRAFDVYKNRIPFCNVEQMVSPKSGYSRFGSAAVMLRSFVRPGLVSDAPRKLAFSEAERAYTTYLQTFGTEGEDVLGKAAARLRHEAQIAFGLVAVDASFGRAKISDMTSLVTPRSEFLSTEDLFRSSVANKEECGQLFLLAMLNPVYAAKERVGELSELAATLIRVEEEGREAFLNAISHCPTHLLVTRIIRPLQGVLTDELKGYRRITKNAIFATKALALLYHGVLRRTKREGLRSLSVSRQEFYNETVSEHVDLNEDYVRWSESPNDAESHLSNEPPLPTTHNVEVRFSFCTYSFLLSEAAKFRILGIESKHTMSKESMRSVLSFGSLSLSIGQMGHIQQLRLPPEHLAHLQFLVLGVRREYIVADAFGQIAEYAQKQPRELRKPLKIIFDGEDGVDEGGVRKEFYQVLLEHILSPDYGMFVYDEETRYHWFRRDFLEPEESWTLIGIMFGLAAFNSILLDVQFPLVMYRKLEGVFRRNAAHYESKTQPNGDSDYTPTLADVKEAFPVIGNSLQHLLDYEGDDVEDVFGLTYQISYRGLFDKVIPHDLISNAESIAVTNSNRRDFVDRYVKYLVDDSVAASFRNFATGFSFMLNGPFVHQFQADELETLVVGEKELDFDALRETTKYEGYTADSRVIQHLWQVLNESDMDGKRLFLSFVTGTDRAPIGGLRKLELIVQRSGGDSNRLPTSHTCFNVLLLPEYGSRAKLRDRLTTAIHNSQGFGLR